MPELKLYTIAQLRDWVLHNSEVEGLSEKIISRTRAWAITHNPYVKEDDPVLSAIFVDGENAAFVTAFPELIEGKRYWWFSALWCNPKYQGNGYGLIVVGSLAEVYGMDCCLDKWGAPETVEIFNYLGHKTTYTSRYIHGTHICRDTIKGRIVHGTRHLQMWMHRIFYQNTKELYTLRYMSYIDDITYKFIQQHSDNYTFLHSQEFLNWVLLHSFTITAPLQEKVDKKMPFSPSERYQTQLYAVHVLNDCKLVGVYILKHVEEVLNVLYIYYDDKYKGQVFASICDHIQRMHISQCITEHSELSAYIRTYVYFPKYRIEKISFSSPINYELPKNGKYQLGDGDGFA